MDCAVYGYCVLFYLGRFEGVANMLSRMHKPAPGQVRRDYRLKELPAAEPADAGEPADQEDPTTSLPADAGQPALAPAAATASADTVDG